MVKFVNKQVDELFNVSNAKSSDASKLTLLDQGKYEFVGRSITNNGIQGYLDQSLIFKPNPANTIAISQIGQQMASFHESPWYASQNMFVLESKDLCLNPLLGLFFTTIFNCQLKRYGSYTSYPTQDEIKNWKIQVPVTPSGELDTEYMASYVKKIEASYVKKIEAYLAVLGYKSLADCQINQYDLDMLHAEPKMGEIKVNSLFSISKLKGLNKNDLNINSKGKYPYITRTAQNNGVESYTDFVDDDHLQPAGTFSLGLMQMSLFYQSKPWYNGQFVRKITPTKNYNSKELMFLQTHLQKLTNLFDPQAIRKVDDVFNKASFTLPVTSLGTPDWQFMEDYITAIEKLKVLKIKQFLDTKINAYQNIIK